MSRAPLWVFIHISFAYMATSVTVRVSTLHAMTLPIAPIRGKLVLSFDSFANSPRYRVRGFRIKRSTKQGIVPTASAYVHNLPSPGCNLIVIKRQVQVDRCKRDLSWYEWRTDPSRTGPSDRSLILSRLP